MSAKRVVILGAAGRDFHDFNVVYREDPSFDVVAFTAAQIPDIAGRRYPPALAGPRYPEGIPIVPEAELSSLVRREGASLIVLSYSDLSHEDVMHKASLALSLGASFQLLGPAETMLRSTLPVLSVCAVRTGAGKSPVSRFAARWLRERGHRVAVIRHPMPYGDLAAQAVQRFESLADLDAGRCTVEEREEYEPHLREGAVVFAGVDYARILRRAEEEADVVVWDGGNNDLPFVRPDLHVVLADTHRPGHESRYHPGETNVRMADLVILSKVDSARAEDVERVRRAVRALNPRAPIVEGGLAITTPPGADLAGRAVVVVEDGPTLTHGGMRFGAGVLAAQRAGARIVDARPHAVGSIREAFDAYPHLDRALPALGYSDRQLRDLEATLAATPCDAILDATPVDLRRLIQLDRPVVDVRYDFDDRDGGLAKALASFEEAHLR